MIDCNQKPSPQTQKKIDGLENEINEIERTAASAVRAKIKKINGILERNAKLADEDDEAMTARLRRYRSDQGFRQVRYLLSGKRGKKGAPTCKALDRCKRNPQGKCACKYPSPSVLKTFEFIFRRCTKGDAFEGVHIPISDFERWLSLGKRQVFRILDHLENHCPYPAPGCKRMHRPSVVDDEVPSADTFERRIKELETREDLPSPGLIVRLGRRADMRFAICLPESIPYLEELGESLAVCVEEDLVEEQFEGQGSADEAPSQYISAAA